MAGAIYGIARPMIANILPNFFNIGPVDSDNVVIGGAGYMLAKKSGLMKAVGIVALAGETANVTQKLSGGMTSGGSTNLASQTVNQGSFSW